VMSYFNINPLFETRLKRKAGRQDFKFLPRGHLDQNFRQIIIERLPSAVQTAC